MRQNSKGRVFLLLCTAICCICFYNFIYLISITWLAPQSECFAIYFWGMTENTTHNTQRTSLSKNIKLKHII